MQTMLVLLVVLQDFVLSLSHELFQDVFAIDVVSHPKVPFAMAKMTPTMKLMHLKTEPLKGGAPETEPLGVRSGTKESLRDGTSDEPLSDSGCS